MTGRTSEVRLSRGIARLGGDDFDEAIADVVIAAASLGKLESAARAVLVEECRRQKEALHANSRRMVVDLTPLGRAPLAIPVEEVWAACTPLVERTLEVLAQVVQADDGSSGVHWNDIAGIYVVGGASALPVVGRLLRERFGAHRVKRSPHPFAATAIGLAVLLDDDAGWSLADRLGRHFGVWREAARGEGVWFDPIFAKDTPLPKPGDPPLEAERRYPAAHNVGHYRFIECGQLRDGLPDGELLPWSEVRFPFEPALRQRRRLDHVPVVRLANLGPTVEERYRLDASGLVEVTLSLPEQGLRRTFTLMREADTNGGAQR